MSFEINLITYFVAVAEELSFRKAANRLHIAQPWLSRQIKNLETQIGFDLFIRDRQHVALTAKGRRLLGIARRITDEVNEAKALVRKLAAEHPDGLRFGLPNYAIHVKERMHLFEEFAAQYPQTRLDISVGSAADMTNILRTGGIDAVFRMSGRDEITEFDVLNLCEGKLMVFMRENHPLAKKKSLGFSDLRSQTIAAFPKDFGGQFFDILFGSFAEAGYKIATYPDYTFIRRLEKSSLVTVLPSWAPQRIPGLIRRPVRGLDQVVRFQILRRRSEHSPQLMRFWKMAQSFAANAG